MKKLSALVLFIMLASCAAAFAADYTITVTHIVDEAQSRNVPAEKSKSRFTRTASLATKSTQSSQP